VTRPIIVTDGEQRAALAVTRSLGRAGEQVIVCSRSGRSLAGASRFAAAAVRVADPLSAPDEFTDDVLRLAREHSSEFIIPISEASLLALLPRRRDVPQTLIPFAAANRFVEICDKGLVLSAAARHGIAIPRQFIARTPEEILRLGPTLTFPLVIKPARSVADVGTGRVKSGTVHVPELQALELAIRNFPEGVYPLLTQERVVGPGVGVFILLWNGEVRAAFAHRRIREKPPSGGVSVLSESIPLDAELLARSVALLRDFEWQGVAMVEYKMNDTTGIPHLMEVNGRFWGSLQLAIDAGVDFPRILVAAARGQSTPEVGAYRIGARLRWEWGDMDNLLARWRRSRSALSLPKDSPGRLRATVDWVRALGPRTRGEVLRIDDPMPFVHESLNWIRAR
jgi:predicted ATP-grasp superfamily ATP-dependent carboligase